MTVKITPVNVATVTAAIRAMLLNDLQNVTVDRSGAINETPGSCPWVGVYRGSVNYAFGPMGFGSGFRMQEIKLVVLAQQSHPSSGENCEDLLEALVAQVMSALLTDVTMGGTVRNIKEIEVIYADYKKIGTSFMQTAAVYLTTEVPVSVSQV